MTIRIDTPRGSIIQGPNGKAQLIWNTNFAPKWTRKFSNAQKFVDNEVLRLCEPFIPLRTGMLIMSGILGTQIGSGTVCWIAPYARAQYYSPRKPGSQTGPLRGPFWFNRMKTLFAISIIQGAKQIMREGL
jgi:hypothetical protein